MSGWESAIIRVSTGLLNTVHDTVIANQAGITGVSKFGGQLGKVLYVAQDQIDKMFDSSVGTLYGGAYRYVKLADDLGTPEPVVGQMLFWDSSEAPGDYVVTDTKDETGTPNPAGVYIGGPSAGEYGFIQFSGLCELLFGALSNAASKGQGVTVSSLGVADNASPVNPIYVGWAVDLPVAHALSLVQLNEFAFRG